jgi:MFS family permease
MAVEAIIQAAQDALGAAAPDDYRIAPTQHAGALSAAAPALAAVLRRSEITAAATCYEQADRDAGLAQTRFKQVGRRASLAVLLATCVSAALLVIGPLALVFGAVFEKTGLIACGIAGAVIGGLATMWLARLRDGKLFEEWVTNRATAEMQRLDYFDKVTAAEDGSPDSPIPLPLLQLEYFRRYQLDVQQAYFSERSQDHRRDAERTLRLAGLAVFLSSVAAGIAGVLGGALSPVFASIAAVGVVGSALSAFASAREALSQDRRNAERYARTRDALVLLYGRLDAVRKAVAGGDRAPLTAFVIAVHDQLASEHRQWLAGAEGAKEAIAKLEESLKTLQLPGGNAG